MVRRHSSLGGFLGVVIESLVGIESNPNCLAISWMVGPIRQSALPKVDAAADQLISLSMVPDKTHVSVASQ